MVTVDEGKVMLDRDGYKMLDIRPFKAYDREHLTKPPQCTANVALAPGTLPDAKFVAAVESQGFPKGAKLLVTDFDGEICQQAADMLHDAGFTAVVAVQGGYNGWRKVFTTCGRRRPPQGKWVSTGKEALKSGLTLDPNVAAAYEENWGKEPPKHGEVGRAGDEAKEEEKEDSASAPLPITSSRRSWLTRTGSRSRRRSESTTTEPGRRLTCSKRRRRPRKSPQR